MSVIKTTSRILLQCNGRDANVHLLTRGRPGFAVEVRGSKE